jgi:hypothetical protein
LIERYSSIVAGWSSTPSTDVLVTSEPRQQVSMGLADIAISCVNVFRHHTLHKVRNGFRYRRIDVVEVSWRTFEVSVPGNPPLNVILSACIIDLRQLFAKAPFPQKHLVGDNSETIGIHLLGGPSAAQGRVDQLRSNVFSGSPEAGSLIASNELRYPEVTQVRYALAVNENVCRLEIHVEY